MEAVAKKNVITEKLGLWFPDLDKSTLEAILKFREELLRFNKTTSVISISTVDKIDQVHIADSIMGWRVIEPMIAGSSVYDIGSGNGFPGIVASLLAPEKIFKLVEADSRKAEFMKHCINALELKNAQVLVKRAESMGADRIDFGMTRGFASIQKTLLTLRRSCNAKASLFHLKGPEWSTEVVALPQQLCSTWNTVHVADYELPESKIHHTIVKSILN